MSDLPRTDTETTTDRTTPPSAAQASDSPGWRQEHFIPLRKSELIRLLTQDTALHNGDAGKFKHLCRLLSATIHHHYYECFEELKDLYAPFNPDSITAEQRALTDKQRRTASASLFERFALLLEKANYRRLSQAEIDQAIGVASDWGVHLHVDFSVFESLQVHVRGDKVDQRTRRSWRTRYQTVQVDVPVYQRLVVMFRLCKRSAQCDSNTPAPVFIKVFKNIPKADLDMLLPGTSFNMSIFDRGKILLPTLTGISIAILKIVKGALLLAFAGVYGILAVLGLVGGTVGYGVKSFLGYLRTKEKYQLNLTRSLYYQNLGNNAGVISRVLDEAEEQELLEAILGYALLNWKAGARGWTAEQLDEEAERYLGDLLQHKVDFEVHDALGKLDRLGCAHQTEDAHWHATPMETALVRLDEAWDNHFRYNNSDRDGTHES